MRSLAFGAVTFTLSCLFVACGGGAATTGNNNSTAPPPPTASATPTSLTFASTGIGSSAAAQTVTLSNTGSTALTGTIVISGADVSDFSQTNTCGSSLAAGAKCTITVTFAPTAAGTRTATLTATGSNATTVPSVSLTGTGTGAASAGFSASSMTFASTNVGTTAAAQTLTLTNSGNLALTGTLGITGSDASDFSETNTCGTSLAAGANCTISVTFTPNAAGTLTATLSATGSNVTPFPSIDLSGSGVSSAIASFSTGAIKFNSLNVNVPGQTGPTTYTQTLTLTSAGTEALTGTYGLTGTGASEFAESDNCGTSLAPAATCTLTIVLTPTTPGALTADLVATGSNAASTIDIPITAAVLGSQANLDTTIADLGPVSVGSAPAQQSVRLTNYGVLALKISSIAVGGTNASDFAETNSCGASLAANGGNCLITLTFTPAAAGARSASLNIADDATLNTTQTVTLEGVGAGAIAEVEPASGPAAGGTIVSIVGLGFGSSATVTFGGVAATNVSVNTAGTLIQATVPAGAADGAVSVVVATPGPPATTVGTSSFTYADQTVGCGANCGDVGDPYGGQGAPAGETAITGCQKIQTGGTYVLTGDASGTIGGNDNTCLHVDYPDGPVILDLGGHTVNGVVQFDSNVAGSYGLMNGTVNCDVDSGACIYWGVTKGHIQYLTVANSSTAPLANIDITATTDSSVTAPILQVDHITTAVGAAPGAHRTRNIMDDGASGSNTAIESIPVEEFDNLVTCSNDASACQGLEMYDAPYSYIHNNQINLPASCSNCTDSARGILFDQYSDFGVAAYNQINVLYNRGIRIRATRYISIHDNAFTNVQEQGRFAAVHVGETGDGIDDDFVSIYNNNFQLGPSGIIPPATLPVSGGSGVVSSEAADVYVFDNNVSCVGGDCSLVGAFAKTDVVDTVPADQTGGNINVMNNSLGLLDAAAVAEVHVCGPTGNSTFDCAGSPTATTTGTVCNTGVIPPTGDGTIIRVTPPCPPPPAAPLPQPFQP